jgi:hypothetical protein
MCEKKSKMYYSFATFEHLIVMRAVTFVLIDQLMLIELSQAVNFVKKLQQRQTKNHS